MWVFGRPKGTGLLLALLRYAKAGNPKGTVVHLMNYLKIALLFDSSITTKPKSKVGSLRGAEGPALDAVGRTDILRIQWS